MSGVGALGQRLLGQARVCEDRKEVKTPELLREAEHRIEVLEDAIKYGIGMIQGGYPMEAALEMDRRLGDPDFDFQNPTIK